MASWGEILTEFSESAQQRGGSPDNDGIRRRYLSQLSAHRRRPLILYATRFLDPRGGEDALSIRLSDLEAFMAVVPSLPAGPLDLMIHSPGGSAEAVEGIVEYLRSKFSPICAIVPVAAMSAGTMLALSCDEVFMAAQSQLGPTDPQLTIPTQEGRRVAAAQAILKQFERAKKECAEDPKNLSAWMPILRSYAPAVLEHSEMATQLSISLVTRWLNEYMFAGRDGAQAEATRIATHLANAENFLSHGRRLSRAAARELGLTVRDLEDDGVFQDLVNSVYFATSQTFNFSPAAKIVENNLGQAYVSMAQVLTLGGVPQQLPVVPGPNPAPVAPTGRAERRRQRFDRR